MFTRVATAGGKGTESAKALVTDPLGNVYITGIYDSTSYFGKDSVVFAGPQNMFLAKYNPATGFEWAVAPVSCQQVQGEALTIDDQGFIYVAGYFAGAIDFGNGYTFSTSYLSSFIAKYSSSGALVWVKKVQGENNNPRSIAADSGGNIILAGMFQGTISYESASLHSFNTATFILKINRDGALQWMTCSTGTSMSTPRSVSVAPDGSVVLVGIFYTAVSFGAFNLTGYGSSDIYICKMDVSGNYLWAIRAGGYGDDWGESVKCATDGSVIINGYYEESAAFGNIYLNTGGGNYSFATFVAKTDPDGNFVWAKSLALSCRSNNLLCLDQKNDIFLTSAFWGSAEIGPSVLWSHGYGDVYVVRMDDAGQILYAKGAGSNWVEEGTGIGLLPSGDLAVTGIVSNNAVFDSITVQSKDNSIFIAILRQHGAVAIDEINYQSSDSLDSGDWVEIRNTGAAPLDLTGWVLKDGNDNNAFVVDSATLLYPASFLVFCQDTGKFNHVHPDVKNVQGPFDFELASNGEKVRLFDDKGLLIAQVRYYAVTPWPTQANGTGRTIELADYFGELSDANNWFNGCLGGSPGRRYQACDSVGITDLQNALHTVRLYPDPVSGNLSLWFYATEIREITFDIVNLSGELVLSEKLAGIVPGENRFIFAAGDWPPGMYLAVLSAGDSRVAVKFIKE